MVSITGCSFSKPITQYEYVTVEVPVKYVLERPPRPKFVKQSIPGYISELIMYVEKLELIIDER